MLDALAIGLPSLTALCFTTLVAGLIYGFAGFGSALIFLPVAAALVPPHWAVLFMGLFGLSSIVTVLPRAWRDADPRAWRDADRRATLTMLGAAIVALPFGTRVLLVLPDAPLRWAMSAVVAVTLAATMSGWRYRVVPGTGTRLAIGAGSGLLGGATGLTGPLVILFQLGGRDRAARSRGNTIVVLTILGIALVPALGLQGGIERAALWIAAPLVPTYMIGARMGQALFDPARERLYRRVAYGVIAAAVLAGLPLWG